MGTLNIQVPEEVGAQYCAGLLDGEGYIGVIKSAPGRWPRVRISISMTDPRPLRAFQKRYGGRIHKRIFNIPNRLDQWQWNKDFGGGSYKKANNTTEEMLIDVLPYLIVKRLNALLALEFIRCARSKWADTTRTPDQFVEASKIFNTNAEFHLKVVGE